MESGIQDLSLIVVKHIKGDVVSSIELQLDSKIRSLHGIVFSDLQQKFIVNEANCYYVETDNDPFLLMEILKGIRSYSWNLLTSHAFVNPAAGNVTETNFFFEKDSHDNKQFFGGRLSGQFAAISSATTMTQSSASDAGSVSSGGHKRLTSMRSSVNLEFQSENPLADMSPAATPGGGGGVDSDAESEFSRGSWKRASMPGAVSPRYDFNGKPYPMVDRTLTTTGVEGNGIAGAGAAMLPADTGASTQTGIHSRTAPGETMRLTSMIANDKYNHASGRSITPEVAALIMDRKASAGSYGFVKRHSMTNSQIASAKRDLINRNIRASVGKIAPTSSNTSNASEESFGAAEEKSARSAPSAATASALASSGLAGVGAAADGDNNSSSSSSNSGSSSGSSNNGTRTHRYPSANASIDTSSPSSISDRIKSFADLNASREKEKNLQTATIRASAERRQSVKMLIEEKVRSSSYSRGTSQTRELTGEGRGEGDTERSVTGRTRREEGEEGGSSNSEDGSNQPSANSSGLSLVPPSDAPTATTTAAAHEDDGDAGAFIRTHTNTNGRFDDATAEAVSVALLEAGATANADDNADEPQSARSAASHESGGSGSSADGTAGGGSGSGIDDSQSPPIAPASAFPAARTDARKLSTGGAIGYKFPPRPGSGRIGGGGGGVPANAFSRSFHVPNSGKSRGSLPGSDAGSLNAQSFYVPSARPYSSSYAPKNTAAISSAPSPSSSSVGICSPTPTQHSLTVNVGASASSDQYGPIVSRSRSSSDGDESSNSEASLLSSFDLSSPLHRVGDRQNVGSSANSNNNNNNNNNSSAINHLAASHSGSSSGFRLSKRDSLGSGAGTGAGATGMHARKVPPPPPVGVEAEVSIMASENASKLSSLFQQVTAEHKSTLVGGSTSTSNNNSNNSSTENVVLAANASSAPANTSAATASASASTLPRKQSRFSGVNVPVPATAPAAIGAVASSSACSRHSTGSSSSASSASTGLAVPVSGSAVPSMGETANKVRRASTFFGMMSRTRQKSHAGGDDSESTESVRQSFSSTVESSNYTTSTTTTAVSSAERAATFTGSNGDTYQQSERTSQQIGSSSTNVGTQSHNAATEDSDEEAAHRARERKNSLLVGLDPHQMVAKEKKLGTKHMSFLAGSIPRPGNVNIADLDPDQQAQLSHENSRTNHYSKLGSAFLTSAASPLQRTSSGRGGRGGRGMAGGRSRGGGRGPGL